MVQLIHIKSIKLRIIKTICGSGIFAIMGCYCIARMTAMDIKIIGQIASPDNLWIALIEDEEYKSMFSTPLYAVVLQPRTGWFKELRGKKIFEESMESAILAPAIKWEDNTHLQIDDDALSRDITIEIKEYKNLKISYHAL